MHACCLKCAVNDVTIDYQVVQKCYPDRIEYIYTKSSIIDTAGMIRAYVAKVIHRRVVINYLWRWYVLSRYLLFLNTQYGMIMIQCSNTLKNTKLYSKTINNLGRYCYIKRKCSLPSENMSYDILKHTHVFSLKQNPKINCSNVNAFCQI